MAGAASPPAGDAGPGADAARDTSTVAPSAPQLVLAQGLVRTYRRGRVEVPALRSVDLTVERGEVLVVVGPSGGGKTTLLNLIGGLDRADAGRLVVAGRDLTTASERDLDHFRRDHVGFVLQFFNLLETASARDNVALGLLARGGDWAAARAEATRWLDLVGLAARTDHRPAELSGGEQQRVAIARAVAGEPELVLADEPTGELDSDTGRAVMDLVIDLNRRLGTTFVVASHDERVATRAHRVVHLRDGRVTN